MINIYFCIYIYYVTFSFIHLQNENYLLLNIIYHKYSIISNLTITFILVSIKLFILFYKILSKNFIIKCFKIIISFYFILFYFYIKQNSKIKINI